MNITVDAWLSSDILGKLQRLNEKHHAAQHFVDDYQVALRKSQIFEVDTGHLKKEVESLHQEVLEKDAQLQSVVEKSWKIAQAEKFESERNKVREENEALSAQMSEISSKMDSMTATMESMTSEKEQAMLDLASAYTTIEQLEARVDQLEKDLANEREACEIAVEKYKSNNDRAEECMKSRDALDNEIVVLKEDVRKLIEERTGVMDRAFKLQSETEEREKRLDSWEKRLEEMEQIKFKPRSVFQLPWTRNKNARPTNAQTPAPSPAPGPSLAPNENHDFVVLDGADIAIDTDFSATYVTECKVPRADFRASKSHQKGCTGVAFSPLNGSIVATGGDDGTRFLWNPVTRSVVRSLDLVVEGGVMDVAFTCNDDHLLAACRDCSVRVWSATGQSVRLTGHSKGVNCVECSPADATRAVSSGEDYNIILWSLERGGFQLASQRVQRKALTVCYNREGNMVLSGHVGGKVGLWDVRSKELCVSNFENEVHNDTVVGLSSFPHSNNLFLSAGRDNRLLVLDLRYMGGLEQVEEYSCPGFSIGTIGYMGQGSCVLGISPDGNFLVAGSGDGQLKVWNRREKAHRVLEQPLKSVHHKGTPVVACAWSPTDNRIVSCDKNGVVVFWEDDPNQR
ncbi:hypothetical protein BSKO_11862 [Bryopsis sp. KO-2023]|nr:hypothetical protein BSKO_11862 [Bryopsis sp. KO-2023]